MALSLLVLSTERWNSKRQARKELLYKALVKSGHIRYLAYIEPMIYWWRRNMKSQRLQEGVVHIHRWKCLFPGESLSPILTVNRIYQALKIDRVLPKKLDKSVGIFYHPNHWLLIRHIRRDIPWVFDWTDDWSTYHQSDRIASLQDKIIKQCDGVVTVSKSLFERARSIRSDNRILHLSNATALSFRDELEEPRELRNIERPRIGFMGHLGPWIDLEMIRRIAEQCPEYQWCILGHGTPSVQKQFNPYKNIHFLGIQDYSSLPNWMASMDILAAPYIKKELIGDASKIYDYLTSGKPIISNSNDTARSFPGLIEIADTTLEWEKALAKCMREKDPHLAELRKREASQNTWLKRADDYAEWLKIFNARTS